MNLDDFKQKFNLIDEIYYVDELEAWFQKNDPTTVFVNKGVNSDSKLKTMVPESTFYKCPTDDKQLYNILCESRVFKNDEEMEIMRWASKITCEAHCNVMRMTKPGMREMQLESFFKYDCEQKYYLGRVMPYTSICGCGPSAATLHYHEADKFLKDG